MSSIQAYKDAVGGTGLRSNAGGTINSEALSNHNSNELLEWLCAA